MPKPSAIVDFSTTLTKPTKDLLERFCKKRNLRMNHAVKRAIIELLENEMGKEIIEERAMRKTVERTKRA